MKLPYFSLCFKKNKFSCIYTRCLNSNFVTGPNTHWISYKSFTKEISTQCFHWDEIGWCSKCYGPFLLDANRMKTFHGWDHIILILSTNIRCIGIKMEREENQGAAVLVEERTMAQGGGWIFNSIAIHSTFNCFMEHGQPIDYYWIIIELSQLTSPLYKYTLYRFFRWKFSI